MRFEQEVLDLYGEPKPVTIGNTNKTGECGMCGFKKCEKLYPQKVGSVDFMICANCMSVMKM